MMLLRRWKNLGTMEENSNVINGDNMITPNFDFKKLLEKEAGELLPDAKITRHEEVLLKLLCQINKVDFKDEVGIVGDTKVSRNQYHVLVIEKILEYAKNNKWGICRNNGFTYVYNGQYWKQLSEEELKVFLSKAALKMGIDKYLALHFAFINELYRQFNETAALPRPEILSDGVLINLKNGTFKIMPDAGDISLKDFEPLDFITYQLPFDHDKNAKAERFNKYLDEVLPSKEVQKVLAEFIGYIFVKPKTLKLEKALLLYGQGANGKSVFFEVISALLGKDNVSNYSLQSLTDVNGYYRAMLASKLVNYASEINGKMENSFFKQLASGEPMEARLPRGIPLILTDYCKLIFNCNELPKEVEQTHAFFRRFLIIPFNVTIPEDKQDKGLAQKIIKDELSGVFNWVLEGLKRLLSQGNFTACDEVERQVEQYKKQSDSVVMFVEDEGWVNNPAMSIGLKKVYEEYKEYCSDCGCGKCGLRKFSERLKRQKFEMERKKDGMYVFMYRQCHIPASPATPATPNL